MTHMLQVSDEAYRRLRARKRGDESFSDLILRTFPSGDLSFLRGLPRDNVKWYEKWHRRLKALDTPRL